MTLSGANCKAIKPQAVGHLFNDGTTHFCCCGEVYCYDKEQQPPPNMGVLPAFTWRCRQQVPTCGFTKWVLGHHPLWEEDARSPSALLGAAPEPRSGCEGCEQSLSSSTSSGKYGLGWRRRSRCVDETPQVQPTWTRTQEMFSVGTWMWRRCVLGCAVCQGLCLAGKRCPRKFRHRSKESS